MRPHPDLSKDVAETIFADKNGGRSERSGEDSSVSSGLCQLRLLMFVGDKDPAYEAGTKGHAAAPTADASSRTNITTQASFVALSRLNSSHLGPPPLSPLDYFRRGEFSA